MDKPASGNRKLKQLEKSNIATSSELNRYKLLVDSVQDYAIFLLDKNGIIISWNKGAEKNKGYAPNEIIGKHFSVFYMEDDVQSKKPERELEIAQRVGRVEDEDWRVRKDGSRFWANVVITALYSDDGELVGYAKVTRDLTERKQHEDTLRKANILLKAQQRELERLNASKDDFVSLASHQLRTPATSIKQYLGMILEGFAGEISPQQRAYVQRAFDSNELQIAIVNNLLRVAQIDAGKVVLHKVPTDMSEFIGKAASDHVDTIMVRGQKLILNLPEHVRPVEVDPVHFRMALDNLIDNASKYTPAGGSVTISVTFQGEMVRISIQDTGVGIAKEDVVQLFNKFSRIPNSLSSSSGGAGLGLYWVNKVVELHAGNIRVKSELNKGTTFNVDLPVGGVAA